MPAETNRQETIDMLLSTPRSVPPTSGVMLKRGAKKFFDIGQAQGWIVRVKADDRYDRVAIELWDWDLATAPEISKHYRNVRIVGTFDATSGAYHGQQRWTVQQYGPRRSVEMQSTWDEKLQDLIGLAEKGPEWRRADAAARAKREAEAEARKLRRSAMEASVRAQGDSPLATILRQRLDLLSKNVKAPDLASVNERYAEDKVLDWKINLRLASHAAGAKKLSHSFVGTSGDERFLTFEEGVALYADRLLKSMVDNLGNTYGGYSLAHQRADSRFVREFHPKWSADMRDVHLVREA